MVAQWYSMRVVSRWKYESESGKAAIWKDFSGKVKTTTGRHERARMEVFN